MLIIPNLHDLSPGIHGFHVHENASCGDNGADAGGHFDPKQTGNHLGPYSAKGHLGDLPALTVTDNGNADLPILAPRLKVKKLKGHSLIIHAGGDNYADIPEKLGGGGARIACGIITDDKNQ
jgi:Cu-Zn family superoxide dismutase